MLGGLDCADEGMMVVDGCPLTSLSKKELLEYRRDKVGIVFQTYNLIGELTVRENIKVVREQLYYKRAVYTAGLCRNVCQHGGQLPQQH